MVSTTLPGGTFKLADDLILTRMDYGAMQEAGPHVFGPPKDRDGGSQSCARSLVSEQPHRHQRLLWRRISPIN